MEYTRNLRGLSPLWLGQMLVGSPLVAVWLLCTFSPGSWNLSQEAGFLGSVCTQRTSGGEAGACSALHLVCVSRCSSWLGWLGTYTPWGPGIIFLS